MISYRGFSRYYIIFIFFSFTYSSSYILSGGTANVGLFPELYYLKHATIVFLMPVTILFFCSKKISLINPVFIMLFPMSSYLFISYGVFFLQFLFFIFGIYAISLAYKNDFLLNKKTIFLLLLLFLSIPVWDIVLNNSNFIYNSFYGRDRLLLGFFHPKEAGISLLVISLMFLLSYRFKNYLFYSVFIVSLVTLLFSIQSRNALLFLVNFLLIDFSIKKIGLTATLFVLSFIYILLPTILVSIFYDQLNLLSSNRLDVWLSGLDMNFFGRLGSVSTSSASDSLWKYKFHIDNFYLEFLIEAGIFYFILLLFSLIYIGLKLRKKVLNNYRVIALFIAFLIFCLFDAGMFSTGNILNIFIWSVIAFVLSKRYLDNA